MRFNTYVACCQEWVCHLDSKFLNITIAMLADQENVEAIFSHQPKRHQAKYVLEKEEVKNNLENLRVILMVVTRLMKLMAPTLWSSRTSVTPSVLMTGRNPATNTTAPRDPTSTTVGHPMGTTVLRLIAILAGQTLPVVMAIARAEMTINIIQAGTATTTAGTTSQEGIETTITKAAAMPANLVNLTHMTKEVKEATVVMIGKKEITIVLATRASHIM